MNVTGIERPFGGENRRFDLSPIAAWRTAESRIGVGLGKVHARLRTALGPQEGWDLSGEDIREVLFQGLKGGGMPDGEATKLILQHFDGVSGKAQFALLALEITSDYWLGLPEGKPPAPKTENEATTPAASTSAPSTV